MSTARKVPSPDSKQHDLFGEVRVQDARPRPNASDTGRRFVTGNPREIVLGTTRLEDYLKQACQRAPFAVRICPDSRIGCHSSSAMLPPGVLHTRHAR
jgi:hypothetical protein